MSSDAVLEADGLGRSFGRKVVLKAASFAAVPGRITCLMGRNGAGKTTMLRIAVGRVRPDYGRILFYGRFRASPSLHRMAREGLFFADQDSALTPAFKVVDHLRSITTVYGGDSLDDVIADFRLDEFLSRRPSRISGGERRRTSLAMATLRDPACLLMDEPFAGVSPQDRPLISGGLRRLRDRGCAIVISGHDVEDLLDLSDEIIWVTAGTTHYLGTPSEARGHYQFRREYLGVRP